MYIAIANHLLYGIIGEILSQITGIMRTVLQFIANLTYWDFGLMWIVKILKNLTFVSIKGMDVKLKVDQVQIKNVYFPSFGTTKHIMDVQ